MLIIRLEHRHRFDDITVAFSIFVVRTIKKDDNISSCRGETHGEQKDEYIGLIVLMNEKGERAAQVRSHGSYNIRVC